MPVKATPTLGDFEKRKSPAEALPKGGKEGLPAHGGEHGEANVLAVRPDLQRVALEPGHQPHQFLLREKKKGHSFITPSPPSPTTGKRSPMTRGGWSLDTKISPMTGGPVVGLQKILACGARENEDDLGKHRL